MTYCSKCGVKLLDGAAFCSACGVSIDGSDQADSNGVLDRITPKKGKSTLAIVLIVCAVVFGLFIMFVAIIATIAVPQLLDARRHSNQRSALGSLRMLASDQETYRADNTVYTTLGGLAKDNKINLTMDKAGYVYFDLMKTPNADHYAVLASPKIWGSSGKKHYIITNEGIVREFKEQVLPFDLSLPANQNSIDLINKLTQEGK